MKKGKKKKKRRGPPVIDVLRLDFTKFMLESVCVQIEWMLATPPSTPYGYTP